MNGGFICTAKQRFNEPEMRVRSASVYYYTGGAFLAGPAATIYVNALDKPFGEKLSHWRAWIPRDAFPGEMHLGEQTELLCVANEEELLVFYVPKPRYDRETRRSGGLRI